jgi:hypothetical protein
VACAKTMPNEENANAIRVRVTLIQQSLAALCSSEER